MYLRQRFTLHIISIVVIWPSLCKTICLVIHGIFGILFVHRFSKHADQSNGAIRIKWALTSEVNEQQNRTTAVDIIIHVSYTYSSGIFVAGVNFPNSLRLRNLKIMSAHKTFPYAVMVIHHHFPRKPDKRLLVLNVMPDKIVRKFLVSKQQTHIDIIIHGFGCKNYYFVTKPPVISPRKMKQKIRCLSKEISIKFGK